MAVLTLNGKSLPGLVRRDLGKLPELTDMQLHHNFLTGCNSIRVGKSSRVDWSGAPRQFQGSRAILKTLNYLDVSGNSLTGLIPSELGNLQELTELHLDSNPLAGPIPRELGNLQALTQLWLGDNFLIGLIPSKLGTLQALVDSSSLG